MARTETAIQLPLGYTRDVTAKTPPDIVELWTTHARKQFEMLSETDQGADSARAEDGRGDAEPITRSINQAFKKAS